MPAVGWWLGDGELVLFEEARRIAVQEGSFHGWILPVLVAMERQVADERGLWVSPSQALVCPRLRVTQTVEPYFVRPEWVWAALNGSAIHQRLAETVLDGYRYEVPLRSRVRVRLGDREVLFPVQGTADLYIETEARLVDIKTTSRRVEQPLVEHELQVNIYAWLMRENGYPVERAELWYVRPGLSNGKVSRKLVPVDLLPHDEVTALLEAIAEPLVRYAEEGTLPPCRCTGPSFIYPDLCRQRE